MPFRSTIGQMSFYINIVTFYYVQMKIRKMLLEHGSEVDPVDELGQTPLHKASKRGDADSCEQLVGLVFMYMLLYEVLMFILMSYIAALPS